MAFSWISYFNQADRNIGPNTSASTHEAMSATDQTDTHWIVKQEVNALSQGVLIAERIFSNPKSDPLGARCRAGLSPRTSFDDGIDDGASSCQFKDSCFVSPTYDQFCNQIDTSPQTDAPGQTIVPSWEFGSLDFVDDHFAGEAVPLPNYGSPEPRISAAQLQSGQLPPAVAGLTFAFQSGISMETWDTQFYPDDDSIMEDEESALDLNASLIYIQQGKERDTHPDVVMNGADEDAYGKFQTTDSENQSDTLQGIADREAQKEMEERHPKAWSTIIHVWSVLNKLQKRVARLRQKPKSSLQALAFVDDMETWKNTWVTGIKILEALIDNKVPVGLKEVIPLLIVLYTITTIPLDGDRQQFTREDFKNDLCRWRLSLNESETSAFDELAGQYWGFTYCPEMDTSCASVSHHLSCKFDGEDCLRGYQDGSQSTLGLRSHIQQNFVHDRHQKVVWLIEHISRVHGFQNISALAQLGLHEDDVTADSSFSLASFVPASYHPTFGNDSTEQSNLSLNRVNSAIPGKKLLPRSLGWTQEFEMDLATLLRNGPIFLAAISGLNQFLRTDAIWYILGLTVASAVNIPVTQPSMTDLLSNPSGVSIPRIRVIPQSDLPLAGFANPSFVSPIYASPEVTTPSSSDYGTPSPTADYPSALNMVFPLSRQQVLSSTLSPSPISCDTSFSSMDGVNFRPYGYPASSPALSTSSISFGVGSLNIDGINTRPRGGSRASIDGTSSRTRRRSNSRASIDGVNARPQRPSQVLVCGLDGCLSTATNLGNLNKHQKDKHSSMRYSCDLCGSTFSRKHYLLKNHLRGVHPGELSVVWNQTM